MHPVKQPWQSLLQDHEGVQLQTSWLSLITEPFGIDTLMDQISAGAFMWVFGSFVFLVPSIYLTARFLANDQLLDEKTGLERTRALAR